MNGLFEVASPFCRRDEPAGPLKERPRREGTGAIALAILCHGTKSDEMVKMRSLLSRLGINVKNVSGCSRSNSLFYVGNHGDQPRGGEEDRCLNEAPFKGPIKVRARKALHGGMILLGPRGVSPQSEAQSLHSIWRSLMNRAAHINSSWVLNLWAGLCPKPNEIAHKQIKHETKNVSKIPKRLSNLSPTETSILWVGWPPEATERFSF